MSKRQPGKAAFFAAFLLIVSYNLVSVTASAAIDVSPVRVDLDNDHSKDVVRIHNLEETVKSYEVEIVTWTQDGTRTEIYAPTDELVAVPPLFTLNPGEEQLVRLGMVGPADALTERTYRMFITELAQPRQSDDDDTGVNMRLRIGIPVFVAPSASAFATLHFVDSTRIDGQLYLKYRNAGNMHIKVSSVTLRAPQLDEPLTTPVSVYVHAGQVGYVPVDLPENISRADVSIATDSLGTVEHELPRSP